MGRSKLTELYEAQWSSLRTSWTPVDFWRHSTDKSTCEACVLSQVDGPWVAMSVIHGSSQMWDQQPWSNWGRSVYHQACHSSKEVFHCHPHWELPAWQWPGPPNHPHSAPVQKFAGVQHQKKEHLKLWHPHHFFSSRFGPDSSFCWPRGPAAWKHKEKVSNSHWGHVKESDYPLAGAGDPRKKITLLVSLGGLNTGKTAKLTLSSISSCVFSHLQCCKSV